MKKKQVLFIGRFQPFHKGHLGTIQKIAQVEDVGELIIGIGSSDKSYTSYNPFTAEEREEMIRSALKLKIPFEIKHIPDVTDNDEWTQILLEKYFDGSVIYSGNSLVIELLTKAGKEVRIPPPIENPSGTEIRQMMVENKNWEKFVPKEVANLVKKIGGEQILKNFFG